MKLYNSLLISLWTITNPYIYHYSPPSPIMNFVHHSFHSAVGAIHTVLSGPAARIAPMKNLLMQDQDGMIQGLWLCRSIFNGCCLCWFMVVYAGWWWMAVYDGESWLIVDSKKWPWTSIIVATRYWSFMINYVGPVDSFTIIYYLSLIPLPITSN